MAAPRDRPRVGDRPREIAEPLGHLGGCLEVELVVVESHALLIRDDRARLQAEEDVVRLGVVPSRVMGIVRGDQWDPRALGQPGEPFVDPSLLFHAVVLALEEIVVAEHSLVFKGGLLRPCLVTIEKPTGHLPAETAREPKGAAGWRAE